MSSFKRKGAPVNVPTVPKGTRLLSGSTSTTITSTGIPSLDDILGGGLPLSCSLLVLAPDAHSAYGELVQKYFVSQGIASNHRIVIIADKPEEFVHECMWMADNSLSNASAKDENEGDSENTKIKIAWRYEKMKQFETTVQASDQASAGYCNVFDLTTRVPGQVIEAALSCGKVVPIDVSSEQPALSGALRELRRIIESSEGGASVPTRICIPSLGSAEWGDTSSEDICWFLISLRNMLSQNSNMCASICLPPHLCTDAWGGPGWVRKLSWLVDASITLSAFTADPSLSAAFSAYHGFVHVHALPAPHTFVPPSDKFSTLRGVSSSGENNLAFKCMRKRFTFETLHLDVEGGVSERRTTPATSAVAEAHGHSHLHLSASQSGAPVGGARGVAAVEVQLEGVQSVALIQPEPSTVPSTTLITKKGKTKKKVAFTSDRPDLYDF